MDAAQNTADTAGAGTADMVRMLLHLLCSSMLHRCLLQVASGYMNSLFSTMRQP